MTGRPNKGLGLTGVGTPSSTFPPHASCQALVLLAKIVYRQAEHVIGTHPGFINVLQYEALMKSHDGVIICLKVKSYKVNLRAGNGFTLQEQQIHKPCYSRTILHL